MTREEIQEYIDNKQKIPSRLFFKGKYDKTYNIRKFVSDTLDKSFGHRLAWNNSMFEEDAHVLWDGIDPEYVRMEDIIPMHDINPYIVMSMLDASFSSEQQPVHGVRIDNGCVVLWDGHHRSIVEAVRGNKRVKMYVVEIPLGYELLKD